MIKLGIIGVSDGNGHPYSFSAIINGYNDKYMKDSGWSNIYEYLKKRDIADFGFCDVKITHVWSQDKHESIKIAKASNIEKVVEDYKDMIDEIDGVIIARDDYDSHLKISKPFLEAGKYVFIDKPLTLHINELEYFEKYLKSNKLFSASGLRYAPELDEIKNKKEDFKLIRGTIIKNWDKYGIHALDAIFSVIPFNVKAIQFNSSKILESFTIFCEDEKIIEIDMLGKMVYPILRVEFFGNSYHCVNMLNAFDSFRRMLWHFINMIKTNENSIDYKLTLNLMKLLIAGNLSKKENRRVDIIEIKD